MRSLRRVYGGSSVDLTDLKNGKYFDLTSTLTRTSPNPFDFGTIFQFSGSTSFTAASGPNGEGSMDLGIANTWRDFNDDPPIDWVMSIWFYRQAYTNTASNNDYILERRTTGAAAVQTNQFRLRFTQTVAGTGVVNFQYKPLGDLSTDLLQVTTTEQLNNWTHAVIKGSRKTDGTGVFQAWGNAVPSATANADAGSFLVTNPLRFNDSQSTAVNGAIGRLTYFGIWDNTSDWFSQDHVDYLYNGGLGRNWADIDSL